MGGHVGPPFTSVEQTLASLEAAMSSKAIPKYPKIPHLSEREEENKDPNIIITTNFLPSFAFYFFKSHLPKTSIPHYDEAPQFPSSTVVSLCNRIFTSLFLEEPTS